jgi:hypothetical protein
MISLLLEIGSAMDAVVILHQNVAPDALVKVALLLAAPGAGWYALFDDLASKYSAFVKKIEDAATAATDAAEELKKKLKTLPDPAAIERKFKIAAIAASVAGVGIVGTLIYIAVKRR